MTVLRSGLLAERVIACSPGLGFSDALADLGALVREVPSGLDDDAAEEWARSRVPLHALVWDARPGFTREGLQPALEEAWVAVRAIAAGVLIPSSEGKIVLLAPPVSAGAHAEALRAALENTARTLSVEWARYGITAVAIAPGVATTEDELAELVGFLVSPAGDYFSGCRLELGAVVGGAA